MQREAQQVCYTHPRNWNIMVMILYLQFRHGRKTISAFSRTHLDLLMNLQDAEIKDDRGTFWSFLEINRPICNGVAYRLKAISEL